MESHLSNIRQTAIRILLLLIPILTCGEMSFPEYFRHLNLEDGLSSTSVFAITQDKLGRMWFATKEGVNVYDGVSIRSFKGWVPGSDTSEKRVDTNAEHNNNKNKESQPKDKIWIGNNATAVVTDNRGDIFFLIDNDVVKYSINSEKFSRITDSGMIRAITSIQGKIEFATPDSIFMINPSSDKPKGVLKLSGIGPINHLSADSKYFYLSTAEGLWVLGRKDNSKRILLKDQSIYSTFLSRNGTIWIPTMENGLYRLDQQSSEPVQVSVPNAMKDAIGAVQCRFATEDHRGKI